MTSCLSSLSPWRTGDRHTDDPGIGVADASMLVLADRLGIDRVLTLDRRHFEATRAPSGRALAIVPWHPPGRLRPPRAVFALVHRLARVQDKSCARC